MAATTLKEQAMNSATRLASKTKTFTRDISTASGSVAYTGIGFTPTSIIFMANVGNICISNGGADSAKAGQCIFSAQSATYVQSGQSATAGLLVVSSNTYIVWDVSSYDADGFTLSWTKTGSPTGTANIIAICFR